MTNKELRDNAQKLRDLMAELGPDVSYDSASAAAASKGLSLSKAQFKARRNDLGWSGPNSPEGQRRAKAEDDFQRKADDLMARILDEQKTAWRLAMDVRDAHGTSSPLPLEDFCKAVDRLRRLNLELEDMDRLQSMFESQVLMLDANIMDPWTESSRPSDSL